MHGKMSLALASMAVVALLAANAQAAIIAQWLLDEDSIARDVTIAADTTGNYDGTYHDGAFFGQSDPSSVTGHDGTPNSAVQFTKDQYVEILAPADPNDPSDIGGILMKTPDFMVDLWFRPPLGVNNLTLFSESLGGSAGPVVTIEANISQNLLFNPIGCCVDPNSAGQGDPPAPQIQPTGGWDDQWYYVAGVVKAAELDVDGDVVKLGSGNLYVYDGTTVFSDSLPWEHDRFRNAFPPLTIDRVRLNNCPICGSSNEVILDDVTFYNQAWDSQSFLAQELGIPEPASLTVLGFGGLLLAKRRQRV